MKKKLICFRFAPLVGPIFLGSMVSDAAASGVNVANFYRGKTIEIVIGYSPGGSYDTYARLISRFIGKNIPGEPRTTIRQMPGAGSRIAANYVYNLAPRDGTVLGTADQSMPVQQAIGDPDIMFDTSKLNWIGNPTADNNLLVVWHSHNVRNLEDIKKKEIIVGATGINTSSQYAQALNSIVGTKFKIILGYPGAAEMGLAMEKGEVNAHTAPWAAWKAAHPDWIKNKKINVIFQVGLKPSSELPDVPLFMNYAETDIDRAALRLFSAAASIGRPLFAGPDISIERVSALRNAFNQTMRDPAFLEAALQSGIDIDPVTGTDLQEIVNDIVRTPRNVTDRLANIIRLPEQK